MSTLAQKITPANIITVVAIFVSVIGLAYTSLDRINAHEDRITRIEDQLIEFRIEYAKQTEVENAQDRYLELQIQHLMEK